MMTPKLRLATLGEVAELLRTTPARLAYILRTRPQIKPAATAGHYRVFDNDAVAELRRELNRMDARKGGRP